MKQLNTMPAHNLKFVFTDIDDTLTTDGQLHPEAYKALWSLYEKGFHVIPVTGRPAGWCEMIARLWPVAGVVGENGGFYFRYTQKKMKRFFTQPKEERIKNQELLKSLSHLVFKEIPEAELASDQFSRIIDLAVDYCEDIPRLSPEKIKRVVDLFKNSGAQVKVSSIHINAWFGIHDKATTCFQFLKQEFGISKEEAKKVSAYCGDSPNDEPLFAVFPMSFGVANVEKFKEQMEHFPQYISPSEGGKGFVEIANTIIEKSER